MPSVDRWWTLSRESQERSIIRSLVHCFTKRHCTSMVTHGPEFFFIVATINHTINQLIYRKSRALRDLRYINYYIKGRFYAVLIVLYIFPYLYSYILWRCDNILSLSDHGRNLHIIKRINFATHLNSFLTQYSVHTIVTILSQTLTCYTLSTILFRKRKKWIVIISLISRQEGVH